MEISKNIRKFKNTCLVLAGSLAAVTTTLGMCKEARKAEAEYVVHILFLVLSSQLSHDEKLPCRGSLADWL